MRHTSSLTSKANTHKVMGLGNGVFEVTSGGSGTVYRCEASGDGFTCTCKWGREACFGRKSGCTHALAVSLWVAGSRVSVKAHDGKDEARKAHRPMADLGQGLFITARAKG